MEADLARFYGVDYRDRWRRDEDGRRRLTLRRLHVLVTHLPLESVTVALVKGTPWTRTEHLLDDLRMTVELTIPKKKRTKPKPHPDRKSTKHVDPARRRKLQSARARARERRRKIDAGEIT